MAVRPRRPPAPARPRTAADGYDGLLCEALNGLAAVAAARQRDGMAATLSRAADALALERHEPRLIQQLEEHFFAPARARLGKQSWPAAYAAGSSSIATKRSKPHCEASSCAP